MILLVWALVAACTPSSNPSRPDAARDAASADAAPRDAGSDDAPRDAACQDMPFVCPWTACTQSVDAACAERPGMCVTDWPADPMAFCATSGRFAVTMGVADPCGGYHALLANGVDGGDDFYYGLTTGKLVAVVAHDYNRNTALCIGGPADFVEPNCDFAFFDCNDVSDASDASGGAGGAAPTDSGSAGGAG